MASRDPNRLYPPLRERWSWMRYEWEIRYPTAPQPFLTATWRSLEEQEQEYREGQGAPPGQSLHNFEPYAFAFDVAFDPKLSDGVGNQATYILQWYEMWGELAEEIGLVWGGRWPRLVDGPHVQMPMTWEDARDGNIPELPPLPTSGLPWKIVIMDDTSSPDDPLVIPVPKGHDIVTRLDPVSRRLWIHVRSEE